MPTNDEWWTPGNVCERLYTAFDGRPGLDPCSHPDCLIRAETEIYENSLRKHWCPDISWYVNPPYSQPRTWISRIVDSYRPVYRNADGRRSVRTAGTIALVKCDPSTLWWGTAVGHRGGAQRGDSREFGPLPDLILPHSRVRFVGPGYDARKSPAFPVAFLVWGSPDFRERAEAALCDDDWAQRWTLA